MLSVYKIYNDDGRESSLNFRFRATPSDRDKAVLDSLRREYISLQNEFKKLQKEHSNDRDIARFYSQMSKESLKLYRAVCFVFGDLFPFDCPKDCEIRRNYPLELDEIRFVSAVLNAREN